MIFSRQQLKPFKVPDTFTHMFGFFTLQLHVKTIWYFQFSSDRNSPCWTTNWKWSMKAFCHHINCYFTVEEEGWPPVGKKSRTVFSNKWSSGKGTVGFRSECDIRMDFDTNEYLNIFVSSKWYEPISEYICLNSFDTNEYPNIFVSKIWYERISE